MRATRRPSPAKRRYRPWPAFSPTTFARTGVHPDLRATGTRYWSGWAGPTRSGAAGGAGGYGAATNTGNGVDTSNRAFAYGGVGGQGGNGYNGGTGPGGNAGAGGAGGFAIASTTTTLDSTSGISSYARGLAGESIRQFEADFPIWENKVHRANPALAIGEAQILRFRRWASRFYPSASTSTR